MKKKNRNNYSYIIIIFLTTLIILLKLFLEERYQGHDTIFHAANIITLSKTISLDNIFGSNIINYELNRFGYGVWLFYPKMPHLTAAYTYLITKDIYLSMKIIYFITTFLSGIFTFYLSKKIFNNKKIALLSAIIYITVPYHVCEIYLRDAFAENFIFMVLPMIFLGLYHLKDDNYNHFYILFILGYIIGMNSHLVSMVFYTFFVAIFILYYRHHFFTKRKLKALTISTLIVTIITSPYLITLLEHKFLNIYRVYTEYFSNLFLVKISSLNFSSLYNQIPLYQNNGVLTYFNIGTIVLFILSLINFIFSKKNENKQEQKLLLIFIILLITIVCSKVIWDYVPNLLISIQFPWRLLILLSLSFSIFAPLILLNQRIPKLIKNISMIVAILIIITEGLNNITYFTEFELKEKELFKLDEIMGFQNEYLPLTEDVDKILFNKYGMRYTQLREYKVISDNNIETKITKDNFPNMEFVVSNLNKETVIELPRIYYLGYKLLDENNNLISLRINKNGFLESTIKENGKYKLIYTETNLHNIAEIIRIITIIVIIVIWMVKKNGTKKNCSTNSML